MDTARQAPFEVLRFSAAPLSADLTVLELEGRFGDGAHGNGSARLLVEREGSPRLELPAIDSDARDGRWRATFALRAGLVDGSAFTLVLRDLLLELPAPDAILDGDRHVALARELNSLRHRLGQALAAADAEAEQARAAQASASEQVQAAELRVGAVEADLATVREELAEARAEGRDLRRALKQARAETEGLRRELDVARRQRARPAAREEEPPASEPATSESPADELPTSAQPTRGVERTVALDDLPHGEPLERVRVLGREGRRASAAPPPATAELGPAPPVIRYLAAAALFVVAVVVLMLLLL